MHVLSTIFLNWAQRKDDTIWCGLLIEFNKPFNKLWRKTEADGNDTSWWREDLIPAICWGDCSALTDHDSWKLTSVHFLKNGASLRAIKNILKNGETRWSGTSVSALFWCDNNMKYAGDLLAYFITFGDYIDGILKQKPDALFTNSLETKNYNKEIIQQELVKGVK